GALETGLNVDPGGAGHAHEVDQRVDVDEFGSLLQQHVQVGQSAVLLPVLQATGSEVVGAGPHGALQRGQQRSEEHTSELQSRENLVCRLLLEKKKKKHKHK